MKRLGKPTAEWTTPAGVRCVEAEGCDGPMVDVRDLVLWLTSLDLRLVEDFEKRLALQRFRTEVVGMQPAAAHRKAVDMLKSFGAITPPELERLPLKKLDGGQ